MRPAAPGAFLARDLRIGRGRHRYHVYVPPPAAARPAPAVLFLHGVGERGRDGAAPAQVGLGPALRAFPDRFPAVVAFPQCLPGRYWVEPEMLDLALAALDDVVGAFACAPAPAILSGISMGGYGSWELAARERGRFATLAVVCAGIPRRRPPGPPDLEAPDWRASEYVAIARRLAGLRVWVFHGDQDEVIPVGQSRAAVAVLRALGADVRYTEFPGLGHNSWDAAYAGPELAAWLFSGGPTGAAPTAGPRP